MTSLTLQAASTSAEARPTQIDRAFRAMGCHIRIVASPAALDDELSRSADRAEQLVHAAAARLTRFDPASELSQLNADPRSTVAVSPLLALALETALDAARSSGGLLDPALATSMAVAGYASTWDPARRADPAVLLRHAPARRPAAPAPRACWRAVAVDRERGTVTRPPGLQFDLAATAKGLIADLALRVLGPAQSAFVDAGGDLAIGGHHGLALLAADPFGGPDVALQTTGPCGVATSSIAGRCWLGPDGPAHHLLDPSTGQPAFTGVVQATAAAPTAALAEGLAGRALLSGPQSAAALVARHGGVLVLDDGTTLRFPGGLLR